MWRQARNQAQFGHDGSFKQDLAIVPEQLLLWLPPRTPSVEAGLLSDGTDWTRNAASARSFTQQLTREIDQAKSVERLLEDRLIHGRGRQR